MFFFNLMCRAVVGNLWTAKQSHLACSTLTNCGNCMAHLVLCFINLRSMQLLAVHTYEEPLMRNCTVL